MLQYNKYLSTISTLIGQKQEKRKLLFLFINLFEEKCF